jgi:hypothetical protein
MSRAELFVLVHRLPSYNVDLRAEFGPYPCPCCGCWTLAHRSGYGICKVCFWEDDGQDDHDADDYRGGPNHDTLSGARLAYTNNPFNEDRRRGFTRPEQPSDRVPPAHFGSSVWTSSAVRLVAELPNAWLEGRLLAGAVGRVFSHFTPLDSSTLYVDFGPGHPMLITHERWVEPSLSPDGTPGTWFRFWSHA